MNNYNCVSQELPRIVVNETKNCKNITKLYWISKGASPSMYIVEYPDCGRRITKIISIGKIDIKEIQLMQLKGENINSTLLQKLKIYIKALLEHIGNLSESNVLKIGELEFTNNDDLHLFDND